jgi:selenide, water dikinase
LSQKALVQVLHQLPQLSSPNLLVGAATADDAGVYRIDRTRALVQTVDFFTPIVDDPFTYGEIAATNSLSDVYAMGGRPLTAMNLMGIPTDLVPPKIINAILRGGATKAKEAKCVLVGGHTIRNPEPFYGLSVTGLVNPKRMITNAAARAGDVLVLTKPLGTGIITTGIKRGLASESLARKVVEVMSQLNVAGAELAEKGLVRAGTDITGFGLLGHLGSLCQASGVSAELDAVSLPIISAEVQTLIEQECIPGGTRENLKTAEEFTDFGSSSSAQKFLLADAQTSGGLLLCIRPRHLEEVLRILKKLRTRSVRIVGRIVRPGKARIWVKS